MLPLQKNLKKQKTAPYPKAALHTFCPPEPSRGIYPRSNHSDHLHKWFMLSFCIASFHYTFFLPQKHNQFLIRISPNVIAYHALILPVHAGTEASLDVWILASQHDCLGHLDHRSLLTNVGQEIQGWQMGYWRTIIAVLTLTLPVLPSTGQHSRHGSLLSPSKWSSLIGKTWR